MLKVIIAGSRSIVDYEVVKTAIESSGFAREISAVVSRCARGVDRLGEEWARYGTVPILCFSADWVMHGRKAGIIRNEAMVEYTDALILVWDGKSRGSAHTLRLAREAKLRCFVSRLD